MQLAWEENDSSTAEAAGFIIFRSQTSGSGFSAIDSVVTESFTDYTVSPNVTYYYKVQAYNSAGNSSQTAQVSQLAGLSGTLTGNITWSTPGAILAGEVELPSGNSITVQAGANITAATGAGVVLKIYGAFNVNGTEASPVTFDRSGSSGNWIGIRYKANSEGTINWATIRYAQKGVWVDNEDSIVLEHCTIENFASQGVYLNGSSNAPIGIMRDTGSQAYATIDGNDISNCSNAGIQVLGANAALRNNNIHGCGYGIRLQTGSNASIHDNDIHANTTGVYLEQSQPSNLKWNNFGYNGSVSANSSASVLINWLNASNSFMASKWNNFYNNGGLDISNQDSDTLAATGQYWNSQNLSGLVNTASAQTSHNANAGPGGDSGKPVVSEEESGQPLPANFTLQQNYPNPFNPSTRIRFALPARAVVSLTIYDMNGRVVRHLIRQQTYEPGWPEVTWDARNDAGAAVGSGIYFYRLTGRNLESNESFVQTHRLLLLR
ncbi:T9SS C-terminal target domain-containing protein [candidate division KSB1 bacterium]|nr:MAG: T9SS C-terminal target domain-containing protein [candidate division KSB1 bacterium]